HQKDERDRDGGQNPAVLLRQAALADRLIDVARDRDRVAAEQSFYRASPGEQAAECNDERRYVEVRGQGAVKNADSKSDDYPYRGQNADHYISSESYLGRLEFGGFAHIDERLPVAAAITFSGDASLRINSPVSLPSCRTMTLSLKPSTSGSSLETSTMARPAL